ncbi:RWD domain-containing protein 2B [Lingula anatina]|uniref:RWD domain-containing protein 2B n=1 Tax=Lingula anatina TaxID=7574 RepID=A0A1S3KCE7_LINAN|nr:RWD domain-containing protein 2B [Lingula anatina]|eukprot:XP_013419931.1 RWD domain-containing protein 2B [Lingula anatina]
MEEEVSVELVREMLELQCAEVELMQSMYSNPGEFVLDDPYVTDHIKQFLDGDTDYTDFHDRISFTLKLKLEGEEGKVSELDLVCRLPHEYPSVLPEVFTRTNYISRQQYKQFSEDLQEFIQAMEEGEICISSIVQWVQENFNNYIEKEPFEAQDLEKQQKADLQDTTFSRLWIYSHHIFSKFKRHDIIEWAKELNLTGFCLPGKPGIVCLEGYDTDIEIYWHRFRRLSWKRIMIKEKEICEIEQGKSVGELRKFENFEEKNFVPRSGKGREYHMDLGLFFQFLEKHDCAKMFQVFFGVDGKSDK